MGQVAPAPSFQRLCSYDKHEPMMYEWNPSQGQTLYAKQQMCLRRKYVQLQTQTASEKISDYTTQRNNSHIFNGCLGTATMSLAFSPVQVNMWLSKLQEQRFCLLCRLL